MPAEKKASVSYLSEVHGLSIRKSCYLLSLSRKSYYRKETDKYTEIKNKILELAYKNPKYGFWKIYHYLRNNEGLLCNHKKIYRLYKELKLNIRRRVKKRIPKRERQSLKQPLRPNLVWSMDFISSSLDCGRRFRVLNVIDDFNREALLIDAGFSFPGTKVSRLIDQLISEKGKPAEIRVDNGPEFISEAFSGYCEQMGIKVNFIQPGKPMQNGFVERFNGSFRTEVLDLYSFRTILEVKDIAEDWMNEYNYKRPHDSLGNISPIEFFQKKMVP